MTSPPLVNPISFSSAQLITRSFGSSLPARVFCAPILFFLFLRKKRTAAPGEEKKENWWKPGSPYHTAIM